MVFIANLKELKFHSSIGISSSLFPTKTLQAISTYSTTANIYSHLEKDAKIKSANVLSNTLTFAD